MSTRRVACYPGSFDPPTLAHVAIVEALLALDDVDAVDLCLSVEPLAKPGATPAAERVALLERCVAHLPSVEVRTTTARLLVDVTDGADFLVLGTDKWAQINEPHWYGGTEGRDAMLAQLPTVLLVPRAGTPVDPAVRSLPIDPALAEASSTAVRAGDDRWAAFPYPK